MRVAFQYYGSHQAAEALCAEASQAGHTVWAWQGDWRNPAHPAAFVTAACDYYGGVDVLVNNAGIWRATPFAEVQADDWHDLYQVNVVAAHAAIQQAAPSLRACGGAVVNVCDAGVYRPWLNYTPYLASKGALATMTMALARELAPDIRVNGVAPGLALIPDTWSAARQAQAVANIPLKRVGTAQDVAEAVLFLAAAPYITGVIVPVDGGVSLRG
jgi:pteridine reductase